MLSFFASLALLHTPLLTPPPVKAPLAVAPVAIAQVPFYSQFKDIASPSWQKVGCGVTSLAMIIDYYKPHATTVDTLLAQAVQAGAYIPSAGWSHSGLVSVSKKYGMTGTVYDLSGSTSANALASLTSSLGSGPVIASVHYKLEPTNPIPHMIVVNGIKNGTVYYNDPANKSGQGTISTDNFMKAWKKRYITIRPASPVKVAIR